MPIPNASLATEEDIYVLLSGSELFLSVQVRVAAVTPRPRVENTFRLRLLNENKVIIDGKLNEFGDEVVNEPRVQDFQLWWRTALPNKVTDIALKFSFAPGGYRSREEELPDNKLLVIQIQ